MRILAVDDNEESLYMLTTLLRGNSYEVIAACDGIAALDILKTQRADLIMSDILMPRMDGFQLCRTVKSDPTLREIPFVFYTATYTEKRDIDLAMSLGAQRFLIKPLDVDVVLQAVAEVLSKHGETRTANCHPLGEEMEFFRKYNEVLFLKLEQKMAELECANQALAENEARLRSLFEQSRTSARRMAAILNNIPDIAWLKDTSGCYIAVNAPFCVSCGRSRQEITGKTDYDLWPEDLACLYRNDDIEVIDSRRSKRVEERLVDHDGRESWIETIRTSVLDSDGTVIGTTGISRDISERKRAEADKTLLEQQLRHAQKMEAIGQLASGIAHDFGNILSVIMACSTMAIDKMDPDDPIRFEIEQILTASNRAAVLTKSLLAFGRKQMMNPEPIELNDVVTKFEKFLLRLLREDIELKIRRSEEALPVIADRGQIEQVLMNLVSNARDAMRKGGAITIEMSLRKYDECFTDDSGFAVAPGRYGLVTVSDTGAGITEDIRSKIFEPFFTTKEVGRGTGLGLAVVYGIVKQHKGHISVCSRLGTGTVFKIYLPLANASVHKDDNEKVTDNGSFNAGTETILIAEDDDMFRNSAAGVLRSHGYNVIEAVDGQDAIARFIDNRDSIRLVVLDGIMPKISGKDAWEEIRSLNPNIKTLFISGYADDTCITTGIPHKGVVFMGKPVTPSELVSVVRRLLDE